jgi:hypothetical protein
MRAFVIQIPPAMIASPTDLPVVVARYFAQRVTVRFP